MSQSSIKKSLQFLHLEKLLILKKEVDFIENILKYFRGYEIDGVNPAKKNINKLLNDIESIKDKIRQLEYINGKYTEKDLKEYDNRKYDFFEYRDNLKFILAYDYTRIEIEEMLLVIEALYGKMNQLFGEMLNQYLPYPTFFGRRYSSIGFMMYLDNYYQDLILGLKDFKDDEKLVLGWSYNNGFRHKILRNRDLTRNNYNFRNYNNYIELPYWYYELPLLIPAITHEVVSISLQNKGSKLYKEYEKFKKTIVDFFKDESNFLVSHVAEALGYNFIENDLAKELFSDIVAYEIDGCSYMLTLFHNLLGENLAKDFLEINYKDDGKTIDYYELKANDWNFSNKRDHNHLRLYFMLNYYQKDKNHRKDLYKEMKELLDIIMKLDKDNNKKEFNINNISFEDAIFSNSYNYSYTYKAVKNYLMQLYAKLIEKNKINSNVICKNKAISVDYKELWKQRFDTIGKDDNRKVPYKGMYRKLIHKNLSELNYFKDEKNELEVKVLTLRKVRKDIVNKKFNNSDIDMDKDKLIENFTKAMDDLLKIEGSKQWIAYGIYDFAYLEDKEPDLDLNDIVNSKDNSLHYFDTKNILMKVAKSIKEEYSSDGDFTIILNIEVRKADISKIKENKKYITGYNDLNKAIDGINNKLKEYKMCFKQADIYKSLGPKDLTVIVEGTTIDTLYNIVEQINKVDEVNRTFSIFCSKEKRGYLNNKKYSFVTNIRIPKNSKIFNKESTILQKVVTKNDTVHLTTGVMDLSIHWKSVCTINEIFKKYEQLLPYMTDYQTKIEKKLIDN